MKISQLTGFVLGTSKRRAKKGEAWLPFDVEVYVCADMPTAMKILANSHSGTIEPNPVWTTIYRVKADNIDCTKIEGGLIWTNQPTRLIVDTPVYYAAPKELSESQLLKNAKKILPRISTLMNNAFYQKDNVK